MGGELPYLLDTQGSGGLLRLQGEHPREQVEGYGLDARVYHDNLFIQVDEETKYISQQPDQS